MYIAWHRFVFVIWFIFLNSNTQIQSVANVRNRQTSKIKSNIIIRQNQIIIITNNKTKQHTDGLILYIT